MVLLFESHNEAANINVCKSLLGNLNFNHIYSDGVAYAIKQWCKNVTRPVKTGHICTQILHHFSNFNLLLLHTYYCYLNETFTAYSKIHWEIYKAYRSCLSYTYIGIKKCTFLITCVICADMPGFRRPSHK